MFVQYYMSILVQLIVRSWTEIGIPHYKGRKFKKAQDLRKADYGLYTGLIKKCD
jgi:hypothetical protein